MKKIITYNVNGIRAAVKKEFLDWITVVKPSILCIQESKAQPDQIPSFELETLGYKSYWYSAKKKGYSGVGIITAIEPDQVIYGMGIPAYDDEGRVIRADFGELTVISVYHPSGSSGDERQIFKMNWLSAFQHFITELKKERPYLVISGDYNICHKPIDIHDPVGNKLSSGFLPEERDWMEGFVQSGFVDSFRHLNNEPHHYTWWSYRFNARTNNKGWRIDYNMVSEPLKNHIKRSYILPQAYHSDHCPCVLELDF